MLFNDCRFVASLFNEAWPLNLSMKLKVSELPQTGITGAAFIATLLFDPSSIPVEADSASDGEAYDVLKRVTGNTTMKMT